MAEKRLVGEHSVCFRIRGLSAMLQDRMSEEEIEMALLRRQRQPVDTQSTLEVLAAQGLYLGPNGEFGIPAINFIAALRGAGQLVKYDSRRMISKADGGTYLYEFMRLPKGIEFLPFSNSATWRVDLRKGRMKDKAKTAVAIIRPKFDEWEIDIELIVDFSVNSISEETLKLLIAKAGKTQGLCAARPSCGMPFGMFEIIEETWRIV